MYEEEYAIINEDFDVIQEQETCEKIVEMVKKLNPKLILPGNENGVDLAAKLSNELGLLSNPIESLDSMTLKDEMQNALKKAGLRHIRGKTIHTVEETLEFYRALGLKEVVIKPTRNAGSFGVTMCSNEKEIENAIESTLGSKGYLGDKKTTELVIQEKKNSW